MSDFTQQMQRMMQLYMQPQTQMKYPSLDTAQKGAPGLLDAYNTMRQSQQPSQPMTVGNPGALMGSMSNGQTPIAPVMPASDMPPQQPAPLAPPPQAPEPSADATGAKSSFGDMMKNFGHPQGAQGAGGGKGGSGSITGALKNLAMM